MTGALPDVDHDTDLARRFLAGNQAAFAALHQMYAGRILAFLKSRCRPPLDAEEISQQVWMKVWTRRSQFDGGQFGPWVFQIARRDLIDAIRKRRPGSLGEDYDVAAFDEDDEDRWIALRECLDAVGGPFLATLRELLDGATTAQIAAREGISEATVYTRSNRGRDALKKCLEQKLT